MVRTTPLMCPQKPTVQATNAVREVSHSPGPWRPTLLRLAYKRPREFGSRAALRGRLTLSGQPITLALRTALARLLAEL